MRRLLAVLAAGLIVLGGVLLLTPYSTSFPTISGRSLAEEQGLRLRCKAPLADVLTSEKSGSYNYDARDPDRLPRASGDLCTPESTWRLTGSVVCLAAGIGLGIWLLVSHRRRAAVLTASPDGAAPG